jgi:hypothetical protein
VVSDNLKIFQKNMRRFAVNLKILQKLTLNQTKSNLYEVVMLFNVKQQDKMIKRHNNTKTLRLLTGTSFNRKFQNTIPF